MHVFLLDGGGSLAVLLGAPAAGKGPKRGHDQAEWHARSGFLLRLLFVSFDVAVVVARHFMLYGGQVVVVGLGVGNARQETGPKRESIKEQVLKILAGCLGVLL